MTPVSSIIAATVISFLWSVSLVTAANEVCVSESKTFTVKVDIHASERGYFYFEECGSNVNPTIGIEVGETYTFLQKDKTNFWHPLGFAYFPDGHHVGGDLVSPNTIGETVTSTAGVTADGRNVADGCVQNMTCPAPMYMLNDGYLGKYSNIPEIKPVTTNEDQTGVTIYKNMFMKSMPAWIGFGTFSVKLKFDDTSFAGNDLFYYCHLHQFMAGRIKLLKNGVPLNSDDYPPLYYEQETPGEFDAMCGTYGLDAFQLPNSQCPSKYVCDPDDSVKDYASCIDAMNCHMQWGMSSKVSSGTELALFLHQMIPHHQNAINMAKATLNAKGRQPCEDLTDKQNPHCMLEALLYGIVNRQTYEIGIMSNVLASMNLPKQDDCAVEVGNSNRRSRLLRNAATTAAEAIFGAAMNTI